MYQGSCRQFNCGGVATHRRADFFELCITFLHRCRIDVPDGIPGIRVARDDLQHTRATRTDQDGRPGWRWPALAQYAVARLVILSLEIDVSLAQERHDDLQCFLETPGQVIERIAKSLVLRLMPARAEAQDEASTADLIERISHFRQQRGFAKRGAG